MSTLDQNQLAYMKNVLGIESVILDAAMPVSFQTMRVSEIPAKPKLVVIARSSDQNLPIENEAKDLLNKMIQAMKVAPGDVLVIDWSGLDEHAASSVSEMIGRFASAPAISFGLEASVSIGAATAIGEWTPFKGGRVLSTHSLEDLLRKPELKKETWAHLQKVMKVIAG